MGNKQRKDSNLILEGFRRNEERILKEVYRIVFPKVRAFILKNSGDEASAKDVFQEAFIACWHNVKDDKFDASGNLEAYLFTIAKNKWTDYLRSSRFKKTVRKEVATWIGVEDEKDEFFEEQDDQEILKNAIQKLGNGCKNLLALFYFERRSMEEIAKKLALGTASARNKKYRCMEQLRLLAQQIKNNG
ncbi:MAG: hypothetical protein CML04_09575 [Pseudozobellia sp.]|nr:hypothetical protein [Pseudozobellia sp.]|tara:strand:- start:2086 stop:2652 length:567 start_codon:yes stop_codon:yes gene_type:complete